MANIFQSLARGASNVTRRAGENLMPEPAEGLLSKEDLGRARRSGLLHLGLSLLGDTSGNGLGPALAQGLSGAQQAYKGAAQDVVSQRGAERAERGAVREENAALKREQQTAQRDQILAKYQLSPDSTPEQIFAQFPKMYAELVGAGLTEDARSLQGIVQQMIPAEEKPQTFLSDGTLARVDKDGKMSILGSLPMSDDRKEDARLDRELKRATISATNANRDAARSSTQQAQTLARGTQIGKAFLSQNRTLVEAEANYQQWSAALSEAKMGNPAAFKSAIVNFVNVADPKAQIRLGVLQFLSKLDPSAQGRFTMTREELINGAHPQYLLRAMEQHVNEIHKNQINLYTHRRDGRLKALDNPVYEQFLPTAEELFPSASKITGEQTAAAAPTSRVSMFLNGGSPQFVAPTTTPTRPRSPYTNPAFDPSIGSLFPRR